MGRGSDEVPGQGLRAWKQPVYGVKSQLETDLNAGIKRLLEQGGDVHPGRQAAPVSHHLDRHNECQLSGF